jgi:hypothetical protein
MDGLAAFRSMLLIITVESLAAQASRLAKDYL